MADDVNTKSVGGTPDRLRAPWETLEIRVEGKVCVVTMNRPEILNAMSIQMRKELGWLYEEIHDRDDIRCVVITGAGRAFSAGGDINDQRGGPEALNDMMRKLAYRWLKAMWSLPQVTVAAVNGVAGGAGCNMALACDLVVASENATFVQPFLNIGLIPDMGGMFMLPRLIGLQRAKEFMLLGDRVSAQRASEMGLVNRVVAGDSLMPTAMELAQRLAEQPKRAVMMTKRLLNRSFETSFETMCESEQAAQSFMFATEDNRRLSEAFLARSRQAKARKAAEKNT